MSDQPYFYLAGPMSGHPQMNIPAFEKAKADLSSRGYSIVSPVELDDKELYEASMRSGAGNIDDIPATWGELLGRDIEAVAHDNCVGVICLPEWTTSKGARLEVFCALNLGKLVASYHTDAPYVRRIPAPMEDILEAHRRGYVAPNRY